MPDMPKIIFINYDKTETGVRIEVNQDNWQLFQDTMIKGGLPDEIIFEDNAQPSQIYHD